MMKEINTLSVLFEKNDREVKNIATINGIVKQNKNSNTRGHQVFDNREYYNLWYYDCFSDWISLKSYLIKPSSIHSSDNK